MGLWIGGGLFGAGLGAGAVAGAEKSNKSAVSPLPALGCAVAGGLLATVGEAADVNSPKPSEMLGPLCGRACCCGICTGGGFVGAGVGLVSKKFPPPILGFDLVAGVVGLVRFAKGEGLGCGDG